MKEISALEVDMLGYTNGGDDCMKTAKENVDGAKEMLLIKKTHDYDSIRKLVDGARGALEQKKKAETEAKDAKERAEKADYQEPTVVKKVKKAEQPPRVMFKTEEGYYKAVKQYPNLKNYTPEQGTDANGNPCIIVNVSQEDYDAIKERM
jgi:hypothetical protein